MFTKKIPPHLTPIRIYGRPIFVSRRFVPTSLRRAPSRLFPPTKLRSTFLSYNLRKLSGFAGSVGVKICHRFIHSVQRKTFMATWEDGSGYSKIVLTGWSREKPTMTHFTRVVCVFVIDFSFNLTISPLKPTIRNVPKTHAQFHHK